jgi:hypothetical protein
MILALAGRRIDTPGAEPPRFPLANVRLVSRRIRSLFERHNPYALVCSAANGADLLALEAAGDLGIRRHIVLPFASQIFRCTSVIDRPGCWGKRFDRILNDLGAEDHLISLDCPIRGAVAYRAANLAILRQAQRIALDKHDSALAVVVWNGSSRGEKDASVEFQQAAKAKGFRLAEIPTL